MSQTPGQLLAAELKRRKIRKAAFARKVGKTFQTIHNWCSDKGFGQDQRQEAARALGEPPDFFDQPDLAEQREIYRQAVLKKFRSHKVGKTLSDEEWRSLESIRWPEEVAPSEARYWGMVLVIRGHITPAEFAANVVANEQAAEELRPNRAPRAAKPTAQKPRKRSKRTPPHR